MVLEVYLDLRREARAKQLIAHRRSQLGLGQEEEVLLSAPQDAQRSNYTRLRREQERVARAARLERLDVVRDQALEVVLGIGTRDA